ncbi:alpha-ketoglutarate-dependent dioxygenase AlkB [Caenimonas sedimenti]|uniref:Alpha-ketoglutarate-dependent dioxygenase AlkB n=1 Tax=Caenimonas sedimenti TaxID=2596921 RepID=A0A562ZGW2_9BURK|nr:alpha-ketoglutarate-dependent dioxygenase AlkB [Caenimonas sedimenti]TWO67820.1 alpha-ketoglutarate-dependent dioxygenase AlkB [Caenimonas sedimenti]
MQASLFAPAEAQLPPGLRYEADFLSPAEEAALVARIEQLPLAPMRYQQYTARRRVVSYGGQYDFSAQKLEAAEPLPDWLAPLCRRAAGWAGLAPGAFTQALVAEYQPGTPLGWHRDVPDFEDVVGISLLNAATLRFRPYPHETGSKARSLKLEVLPRSIYLLHGPARWEWQHHVPPTKALRYSITLRTPSHRRGTGR